MRHMWAAYHTLADKADEDAGKPAYFRFLTLLGFKIFLEQKVDVAILEVGLGGRLDATNCVREPVVCGVTALGMDHVALLGDTLPKIAREKAGIFKPGKPAFTVPQRDDAQEALFEVAHKVGAPLEVVPALDTYCLESPSHGPAPPADPEHLELGLAGEHQRQNAALAVMLAAEWEGRSQAAAALQGEAARRRAQSVQSGVLPREYVAGLQAAKWPGRGQIIGYDVVEGQIIDSAASRLTFFLDGAHTAESMATCAHWFADASAAAAAAAGAARAAAAPDAGQNGSRHRDAAATDVRRVLLFNCLEERDANNLLRPLRSTLAARSAVPGAAIFVPPESTYMKLGPADAPPELAWQLTLRGVWERLGSTHTSAGGNAKGVSGAFPPLPRVPGVGAQDLAVGAVLPNLRGTLDWLRRCAREAPAVRMHVLVTGSLYLVGDLLKILGKGSE